MKKIVIIPNTTRDPDYFYTSQAERTLQNEGFSTERFDPAFDSENETLIFENAFAILVLGGDGTILSASHYAAEHNVPILAVNLGRLGYIAQLEKSDLDKVASILNSSFQTDERAMLSVSHIRDGETVAFYDTILNDAVVSKATAGGIIEFDLYANSSPIGQYRGDGMIFSTATGSTAYSMSAGGTVIDPALRVIEVTPLALHSLKARPIVFSENHTLEVVIRQSATTAELTLDGEISLSLLPLDRIDITLSQKSVRLISYYNDFCHILHQKMSDI